LTSSKINMLDSNMWKKYLTFVYMAADSGERTSKVFLRDHLLGLSKFVSQRLHRYGNGSYY
jgi:hypothetical protein